MNFRIISIGALSVHELWDKQGPQRTPHATCTLIRSGEGKGERRILVDPGLPPQVIVARLAERSGLSPADISDVFLTNFRPAHRWGLPAFPDARWLIFEREREAIGRLLVERYGQETEPETRDTLKTDIALLQRCQPAPDQLAPHVDLFPLPGYTPGTCGLLLSHPTSTTLIAGDAVPTHEHLHRGRVLRGSFDVEAAQESLLEAAQIADAIVCGHDNVIVNPGRRGPLG